LLPAFESAYHALYPLNQTAEGKTRQRLPGGGTKGTLRTVEDKLLFILVYQKTVLSHMKNAVKVQVAEDF
jgi:hypothetical protein